MADVVDQFGYTKGAWVLTEGRVHNEAGDLTIAQLSPPSLYAGHFMERDANAGLIVASKDMLRALLNMDLLMENLWQAVPWGKTCGLDAARLNTAPAQMKLAIERATAMSRVRA